MDHKQLDFRIPFNRLNTYVSFDINVDIPCKKKYIYIYIVNHTCLSSSVVKGCTDTNAWKII